MPTRVLAYLEWAEAQETDPDYQDSYRCAWITLYLACQDSPLPFVEAFYRVYGIHPDRMTKALTERRLAQLGTYYEAFWGELPPKKPSQSAPSPAATLWLAGT